MKLLRISILLMLAGTFTFAQDYPFQDPKLDEEARLDNLLSLLTLEEKVNCMATRPEVPRLGIRKHRIIEGLHGVALSGPANWAVKGEGAAPTTTFPQAYGLAQMWDPVLMEEIAAQEAYECRYLTQSPKYASGGLIMLAPNADLGRDIRWGRTEECFGEDAYLGSRMTVAFVKGLQGDHPKYWKTASLMKHFLANSNENNRFINSSDFDERLYREYYSYTFYKGITEGGSRAYMAAYNKINGIPAAVHPMLKEITVDEWGQNGIICTDGGAFKLLVNAHKYYDKLEDAAAACVHSGINMFLDDYKPYLKNALDQGLLSEEDMDESLRGTLRVWLKLGLLDQPESEQDVKDSNPYTQIGLNNESEPWDKPEVRELARKATVKSIVLLKNEDEILPINKEELKSIAIIGPASDLVVSDWYSGTPPYQVSALQGIRNALVNSGAGEDIEILHCKSNMADSAVIAAKKADIAIVCVGNHPLSHGLGWGENLVASEGREAIDREAISMEQEDLVKLVKAANPNTVMVLISSFPYAINWSAEHVPAIVHITQSSQELGNGLADVLFGKVSPAGKLVQTWTRSIDELLPILEYDITKGRTYMYDKHEPLFPFGHGLTYTSFELSDLSTAKSTLKEGDIVDVSFKLTNTGDVDSDEVVQLYVSYPESKVDRPDKALKGFKRVFVPAGETRDVSIALDSDELRYWNVEKQSFVLEKGDVNFYIGSSSVDKRLGGSIRAK